MSMMKKRLDRMNAEEDRFAQEVHRDHHKAHVLIGCATELAGYYTGTRFIETDNGQWLQDAGNDDCGMLYEYASSSVSRN